MTDKLPTEFDDNLGGRHYSSIGQAEADLTSALMALDDVVDSHRLTAGQRRDFLAARRGATKAAEQIRRHVAYGTHAEIEREEA